MYYECNKTWCYIKKKTTKAYEKKWFIFKYFEMKHIWDVK